jgi:hypothetical protein
MQVVVMQVVVVQVLVVGDRGALPRVTSGPVRLRTAGLALALVALLAWWPALGRAQPAPGEGARPPEPAPTTSPSPPGAPDAPAAAHPPAALAAPAPPEPPRPVVSPPSPGLPAPGPVAATATSPVPLAAPPAPPPTAVAPEPLSSPPTPTLGLVEHLARIRLAGYVQGRYEWHADSSDTIDASGNSQVKSQFLVRRGRLKATYDGANTEYLLQIDATPSGVALEDAEATFVDTWTPIQARLTVGQFKWPFGYEVLQSDADREMPEPARVIGTLFPGARDRGLRLTGHHGWLHVAAALVNGNVPNGPVDRNGFKDLVGRVGGDFGWIVGGLSGYYGRRLDARAATPFTTVWTDKNGDKMLTPDEVTNTPARPASYQSFGLLRLGADLQTYLDVPVLGGLALKGEFIYAKDSNRAEGATAANPCLDRTQLGWIVTAVQSLGRYAGLVVRLDSFDPNVTLALPNTCQLDIAKGLGDRINTYGFGALIYPSGDLKATFTYEHVAEQSITVANDVFTAQLQARF